MAVAVAVAVAMAVVVELQWTSAGESAAAAGGVSAFLSVFTAGYFQGDLRTFFQPCLWQAKP